MPFCTIGRTVSNVCFLMALAILTGCVPAPVSRSADPQSTYAPPFTPAAGYGSKPGNGSTGYGSTTANGPSSTVTTHYYDPNVRPASATSDIPPGYGYPPGQPQTPIQGPVPGPAASPYVVPDGQAGPPPGYARPAQAEPIVVAPVSPKKSDEDEEWDISHLAPDYTWKKVKEAIGWGPDEKLAKEAYDRGQALFRDKKYEEAAKEFYTATWRWPDSTMEEDAMFLMGESYFFSDHYGKSQDTFTNLLKAHDNTRYLDTVVNRLFAIGTYWEQLDLKSHSWPLTPNMTDKTQPLFDTIGNALACYSLIWTHDPTGPLADAALFRVANAHFRRGEWEDAADHYKLLRVNHPKSKYQKDAHLLEIQARLRIYQGPLYSVVPLKDAQEIADQTLKQFPGQLGPEEQRVRQDMAMMVEQRAEREWTVAQYYDKKAEYRAAREYYKAILEKYPKSSLAPRAAQRLEEIKSLPDEPPNHFKWLTAPFGDGK
jgi:outer membrane protein assembly factor BamD (BamD/ComL family)